ncbi:UDP-N-acetylmuramoyl-tripeptide--D-alanyl-D-alanine ligase [Aeromicrobium sp. Root495]|uniref:UDP-N-acetylmuramoyl-tripeptide--D-alanyl-D- alanine ligase n=1 Tax=Aeromicrobium sp. Root495 TaxID=1736550 RepID=UPI000A8F94CA|nr:UDP-N-acetylmuramoyl-tripeptide--D-alanyl-D-alanine ligase [Aeromicrobium sp. Root495]
MTIAEIASVVGGEPVGDLGTVVSAPASLDSRAVPAGGLFVALAGENVDGHDYAEAAVRQGAAAVLGSRDAGVPGVVVDDVTTALGLLARHVLGLLRPGPVVVALTGSQGKTSVKDLVAAGLRSQAVAPDAVVATLGNLNNELGVPLTVLRATQDTSHLVVEMGARGIGHVAALCEVAPPDVAMVLNVGTAHVGEFGSRENIAQAKGEIVESLGPDGLAVLNADDPLVSAMVGRTRAPAAFFGRTAAGPGSVRVVDVAMTPSGEPEVTLAHDGRTWTVHVPLLGEHQALNAAAAACVVLHLHPDAGVEWLAEVDQGTGLRLQRHVRSDGVTIIDDSYNANPESVRAGLDALAAVAGSRRVAVLGEMLELGEGSAAAHEEVGAHAAGLGLDRVVVVGDAARGIAEGAGEVATLVPDVAASVTDLRAWLRPGDVVLVKASRGARLERVTAALLQE